MFVLNSLNDPLVVSLETGVCLLIYICALACHQLAGHSCMHGCEMIMYCCDSTRVSPSILAVSSASAKALGLCVPLICRWSFYQMLQ
jgi:hypothetical protein